MTPEDISAWHQVLRRFVDRAAMRGYYEESHVRLIYVGFVTLWSSNADFFLTHHSASSDVSDYERMRRWASCSGLSPLVKLRSLR